MKKHRSFLLVGTLLLTLFVVVSAFTFTKSRDLIQKGYLASEGNAAENFAVLTAANIHLTDEQVEKLKSCTYSELMASEENNKLKSMMGNGDFMNKVDYAYIMVHLKNDEVKYSVNDENKETYDAPIGTKLDIMWLLDVNVSEETEDLQLNDKQSEYTRYSYYIKDDEVIFGEAPTYIYNSSEWGDHICGYSPIYTEEGNYIGVIGVELQTGDYTFYCNSAVFAMGALLVVSLIMLSVLFIYIYLKYRKIQSDKIYLDSLTQIYNRSYYNNRFIKVINGRRSGDKFALLITDVDFFKKVNDTFGHEVGDEVLKELGEILVSILGMKNTVRFGGEEFVSGLWIAEEKELTDILDELYRKIAEHKFSSREITLTVSLGCSYYKTDNVNGWLLSGLLRAADCKLYEAKESGRNRYFTEKYDENKKYEKSMSSPMNKGEANI